MSGNNTVQFNKYHRKRRRSKGILNSSRKSNKQYNTWIIVVLVIGVSLLCAFLQMKKTPVVDVFSDGYDPATKTIILGKTVNYDLVSEAPVKDHIWVMYQNLSPADKQVYDMFLDLVEHRDEAGYKSSIVVSDSTVKSLGDEYFWNIYSAMYYDHPEYFFLMVGGSKIHAFTVSSAGQTRYIYEIDPPTAEETAQIKAFENAAKTFMQDIDTTLSDAEIELQIHDKLIQTVSYDYDLFEKRSEVHDLGHTAYGALVEDSSGNDNLAVCEGYSLAFEYLMHQADIPCAVVSGDARHEIPEDIDNRGHAWNVVNIDGRWYEVDSTWDDHDLSDIDDMPGAVKEAYKNNEVVRYNDCHFYYNKTTKEMENLVPSNDTVLNVEGYQSFNTRLTSSHIRETNESTDTDETKKFLNALIPTAE